MNNLTSSPPNRSFAALRQFARPKTVAERCELCSVELAPEHQHLLEPENRRLVCACDACALLFAGQADTKYRRVPRRVRSLSDFHLSDAQWDGLLIPINMAFFFQSTPAGKTVALYPSPGGATESLLVLDSWDEIVQSNTVLQTMEPDVEALLVKRLNRGGGGAPAYYLAPIDECYKLVGLLRTHWRGLSGGTEVWHEIETFFQQLKEKSETYAYLEFQIEGAEPLVHAAAPLLAFKLRVTNSVADESIHNIMLECQIRIEPTRRSYDPQEQHRLIDLFGEPPRWSDTLRSMLWTHANVTVPPFTGSVTVNLHVPCTFDFNVAATKYFAGLADGEIPLNLLFSGTIFYAADVGLQVSRVSWEKEARFRLPVRVWQQMMEHYYPNSAWLCCRRDVFQRFYEYKQRHGIPTWEQALESLLDSVEDSVPL